MGLNIREQAPSILVATLSSSFGVVVIEVLNILTQAIAESDVTGRSGLVRYILSFIGFVFVSIAVYVGALVTSNAFSTIIAGRTRTIALMRLIGATASSERRAVAREGLAVGIIGAVLGGVIGTLFMVALIPIGISASFLPRSTYAPVSFAIALPIVGVALTTWLASWIGSRRVLDVSPIEAASGAIEARRETLVARHGRNTVAIMLSGVGVILLGLAVAVGLVNAAGVLIGVVGGLLSFSGLVLGAHLIMPPALRLTGRLFGSSATARLAAENAIRFPERSSRTTLGLVIGVTLISMFIVAMQTFESIIRIAQKAQPGIYQGIDQVLLVTLIIFSILIGFSALIAAVGMVNSLSLSVLQRTREIGLLRALGFTIRQIRWMILAEGAQLTIAAALVGLFCGTVYGWTGAESLVGSIVGSPGLVPPTIPLPLIGVLAASTAVLTMCASIAPSRRATRITPVGALAVE